MRNSSDMRIQKQPYEKVLFVMGGICSISIIVLACMQISGIWKTAINALQPVLGILMLIQTIQNWKKNRVVAKISLCAAILVFSFIIFRFITI